MANPQNPDMIRNRGIYLLPNLLTTATLFAGFFAIVVAGQGDFVTAAIAVFAAMISDGLDGMMARLTNTQTAFGKEFDSLADMVAFGVSPALVMHSWALFTFGKLGWAVAFIYVAMTALRLARFNVQVEQPQQAFKGLPCTLAAGIVSSFILLVEHYHMQGSSTQLLALLTTALSSGLMISYLPYWSTKALAGKQRASVMVALIGVLGFSVIALDPPLVLFVIFFGYGLSGPLLWLFKRFNLNLAKIKIRLRGLKIIDPAKQKKSGKKS